MRGNLHALKNSARKPPRSDAIDMMIAFELQASTQETRELLNQLKQLPMFKKQAF